MLWRDDPMEEIIKGMWRFDAGLNNFKLYAEMMPYIEQKYEQERCRAFCIQGTERFDETQIAETPKSIEGESLTEPLCKNAPYANQIIEQYGLFHTRLMNRPPRTCYDYHTDPSVNRWAVHIPILTNDSVFVVVDGVAGQMPDDGCIYFLDTYRYHTVLNGHKTEDRWHIVAKMHGVHQWMEQWCK